MEGRKRLKVLQFDPSDPCRRPLVPGAKVIEVCEADDDALPFVGQLAAINETRRSSRESIPTDFYHDFEKNAAAAVVRKQEAAKRKVVAVRNEGTRHSARKSIPTDFYVAGLHDAIARSARDSPKKKDEKVVTTTEEKSQQQIPKKKSSTIMKHKIITIEEAVLQMERYAQEEREKKPINIKRLKKMGSEKETTENAKSSLPPKSRERGHFASPMVLIPLSECLPTLRSSKRVQALSPRKRTASPTKIEESSPQKQQARKRTASPTKNKESSPRKRPASAQRKEKTNGDTPVKRKKRRRTVIPAALRRKSQAISLVVSTGNKATELQTRKKKNASCEVPVPEPKEKKETLNEVQASPVDDDMLNSPESVAKLPFANKAKKNPKKNQNGFKNKIGKLVRRSAPVKLKWKRKRKMVAIQPKPPPVNFDESDWADAEGDDGFYDDDISWYDENESTQSVISALDDTSVIKESGKTTEQLTPKRGLPHKPEKTNGGIDVDESTEQVITAPYDASAIEKSDKIAVKGKPKRGRPRKVEQVDGGIGENKSTHKAIQAPNEASAAKNIFQTLEQPKRITGRPRKSELENAGIVEPESTQEATQVADNARKIKESDQNAMQSKRNAMQSKRKRGRSRKSELIDCGIDTQKSAQHTTRATSATEKREQILKQPKLTTGRSLNSDRKEFIVEKESSKDATHTLDNSSVANNVVQLAWQPNPSGAPCKNVCGDYESTMAKPKRGRGRPRKNGSRNEEAKPAQQNPAKGRWRRSVWKDCGKCLVCRQAENCGRCEPCLNMPESGGDGSRATKCVLRVCITPVYILNDDPTNKSLSGDVNENDKAVASFGGAFMENSMDRNQGVSSKEVTVWRDSGVESLSDNDSMVVDHMSDMEWDDGYKRPFASATVAAVALVEKFGVRKPTQADSLPNQQTAANAVGKEGQIEGAAGHNALGFAERSDPTDKTIGKEITSDSGKIGDANDVNLRSGVDTSHEDAAGMARKLLRYERMQYLNDDSSYESSSEDDCLLVPPPPPLDCEQLHVHNRKVVAPTTEHNSQPW